MPKDKEKLENRIDEFAVSMFGQMGYDANELPDSLVEVYQEFKRRHDILRPSRLTAEGLAFCSFMADMMDQKILLTQPTAEPAKPKQEKKG